VAVGGGGIRTMQRYWERTTANLERTGSDIKRNADPEAGKQAAQQRLQRERAAAGGEVDLREETVPMAPSSDAR
jgi:hypothetical protein